MATFRSELILPSHADSGTIARAYARELASTARLAPEQGELFAVAVSEACGAIVHSGLGPGAEEPFHLLALVTPRALTMAIRERGAPFDPTVGTAPSERPGADCPPVCIGAPCWQQIHRAVDVVHWSNRGTAGMELHLVKYRSDGTVMEHLPTAELTPFTHDVPLAPAQRYTVRRFEPGDAVGVAQSIYRAFGYTYADADIYYPARIVHLNETGQLVSVVALDEAGTVVGHLGLERPDLGAVAESSDAAVVPAHRHRHLLQRLREFGEAEATRLGLEGLVGYSVTTHPFSQRMEEDVGAHLCAVVLGQLPRSTRFPGIVSAPIPQRVSTMLYFKYLVPTPAVVMHPPPRHAAMLERLYANLEVATTARPPGPRAGAGHVTASLDRIWGFGEISVERVGADTAAEIRRACQDLCAVAEVDVVYLYLPLAQAGTPDLCADAEAQGFFFSGLGPRFLPDGDALCLQHVPRALDPRRLQVASPFGQELLRYVESERARVQA
jgi:predicted N-acetyltransferase YhbS